VVGLLAGPTIFGPFGLRFQTETMREGSGFHEGSILTQVRSDRASPEPVAPVQPTCFCVDSVRMSQDVGRLVAGPTVFEPFGCRFQPEAVCECAGFFERLMFK